MSLHQCHPNSARSLIIARRTELNPHCFCCSFVLSATPQTGGNSQGIYNNLKKTFDDDGNHVLWCLKG